MDKDIPFQDYKSVRLMHNEELGRAVKVAPVTTSYLQNLSSALMTALCSTQDDERTILKRHLTPQLRDRFESDDYLLTITSLDVELLDVQTDVDLSGVKARTWCLNFRGFRKGLSRENIAVMDWELREHRLWMCVDIRVVPGGVGF